ncbi:uncharacterized protein LOC107501298 [Rousettus aegyptiacus]|uniref:uncharacterized protein LOC107501298 n=1 Tax=Rousettus aegyptiacus TaxID=9407 RepID=UPI0007888DB7|nr:uncharacterized protein LOC107501298 [Rousettus aegyptiacus]
MSTAPDVKKQSDSAVRNPLWETNESRRLFHDDTALGTKSGLWAAEQMQFLSCRADDWLSKRAGLGCSGLRLQHLGQLSALATGPVHKGMRRLRSPDHSCLGHFSALDAMRWGRKGTDDDCRLEGGGPPSGIKMPGAPTPDGARKKCPRSASERILLPGIAAYTEGLEVSA